MTKPSISVCIITDGADLEQLAEAVASVHSCAKEILIDANGNYEAVYELFKPDKKVSVKKTVWQKDFAQARNAVIRRALYDWILMIDSDEKLMTEIKYLSEDYDAYSCRYMKVINEQISGTHINCKLFKNDPNYEFVGAIHEVITGPVKVALCDIVFIETHRAGLTHSKINRNAEILLASDQKNKDFLLCQLFSSIGKPEKAIYHGEKCLADNDSPTQDKAMAAWFLSRCYPGKENKLAMLGLSIILQPRQVISRVDIAALCDNKKVAIQQLEKAAEISRENASLLPMDFYFTPEFFESKIKENGSSKC